MPNGRLTAPRNRAGGGGWLGRRQRHDPRQGSSHGIFPLDRHAGRTAWTRRADADPDGDGLADRRRPGVRVDDRRRRGGRRSHRHPLRRAGGARDQHGRRSRPADHRRPARRVAPAAEPAGRFRRSACRPGAGGGHAAGVRPRQPGDRRRRRAGCRRPRADAVAGRRRSGDGAPGEHGGSARLLPFQPRPHPQPAALQGGAGGPPRRQGAAAAACRGRPQPAAGGDRPGPWRRRSGRDQPRERAAREGRDAEDRQGDPRSSSSPAAGCGWR